MAERDENRKSEGEAEKATPQLRLGLKPNINQVSLRTAVEKGDGSLDKDATSHNDVFDAFRLSLMRYR